LMAAEAGWEEIKETKKIATAIRRLI